MPAGSRTISAAGQAAPALAGVPVVEVRGVEKRFANGTQALAPVDLVVQPREFVTLLGPSGCGKSTLLRAIAGLTQPSAGSLSWWGSPALPQQGALGLPSRKLVFVFQDATLMPWARVRANVRLPLDLAGLSRAEADRRVDESLSLVGLSKFDAHFPRQLSGGMQMRASIARALVTEPDLLLLDEPFGALDEITRNRLDADLLELWWRRHLTVMFVTHSIYEAVFLSTRVVVMSARPGRVLREVVIDEPHPRTDAFRLTPRFAAWANELSTALHDASTESGGDPVAEANGEGRAGNGGAG
jgi:NitT/TauT family transport system ATP-binding protein